MTEPTLTPDPVRSDATWESFTSGPYQLYRHRHEGHWLIADIDGAWYDGNYPTAEEAIAFADAERGLA